MTEVTKIILVPLDAGKTTVSTFRDLACKVLINFLYEIIVIGYLKRLCYLPFQLVRFPIDKGIQDIFIDQLGYDLKQRNTTFGQRATKLPLFLQKIIFLIIMTKFLLLKKKRLFSNILVANNFPAKRLCITDLKDTFFLTNKILFSIYYYYLR